MEDEVNIVFNNIVIDVFLPFVFFFSLSSDRNIYIVTLDNTSHRETWIGTSPRLKSSSPLRKSETRKFIRAEIYIFFDR